MALVICPECNKQMSQYAKSCLNCGFPIQKFMNDNNMNDETKAFVCPKCADTYKIKGVIFLKCEFCNTTLVQTDMSIKELFRFSCNSTDEEFESKAIELAKKYGDNQFDENAYNETKLKKKQRNLSMSSSNINQSQQENTPKCPLCGSTAITDGQRGYALLTGFLGSNKTVNRCINCGYSWKPGK